MMINAIAARLTEPLYSASQWMEGSARSSSTPSISSWQSNAFKIRLHWLGKFLTKARRLRVRREEALHTL